MKPVNIQATKTHLSRLVEEAAAGEEIILAKSGKPFGQAGPRRPHPRSPRRRAVRRPDMGRTGLLGPRTRMFLPRPSTLLVYPDPFPAAAEELGVKVAKRKLSLPANFAAMLRAHGFSDLPIHARHAERALALRQIRGDPFDRMW